MQHNGSAQSQSNIDFLHWINTSASINTLSQTWAAEVLLDRNGSITYKAQNNEGLSTLLALSPASSEKKLLFSYMRYIDNIKQEILSLSASGRLSVTTATIISVGMWDYYVS
jgi:hypothetical protein